MKFKCTIPVFILMNYWGYLAFFLSIRNIIACCHIMYDNGTDHGAEKMVRINKFNFSVYKAALFIC